MRYFIKHQKTMRLMGGRPSIRKLASAACPSHGPSCMAEKYPMANHSFFRFLGLKPNAGAGLKGTNGVVKVRCVTFSIGYVTLPKKPFVFNGLCRAVSVPLPILQKKSFVIKGLRFCCQCWRGFARPKQTIFQKVFRFQVVTDTLQKSIGVAPVHHI